MRASEKAWAAIGIGTLAYEIAAPKDELLSEQVDRWMESENRLVKYGTPLIIGIIAAHLTNAIPEKVDPLHQISLIFENIKTPLANYSQGRF
tara:strand:- start:193 stop:468 length:276 start_codon:yes stop_codon:yes gene_type:complete